MRPKNTFKKLKYATVDLGRPERCGFPEVIFCPGKTPRDIARIAREILKHAKVLLATRADKKAYQAIKSVAQNAVYHRRARAVTVLKKRPTPNAKLRTPNSEPRTTQGLILIITAGTSDIPVAEEARVTAETMGHPVKTLYDVGVAGVHRLLAHRKLIAQAKVIIVVAGMEGALASVVGGLVDKPVIAVPTSIGYGASFEGLSALLTMMNSCAAGVAVVNIDNGFGAGYIASLIRAY